MIPFIATSIVLRVVALGWCIVLWARLRDIRMGWFAGLMLYLSIRQSLTLTHIIREGHSPFEEQLAEVFAIGTTIVCLGMIWGLSRMLEDRERINRALQRSEQTQRALIEAIPDVLFRIRRDGTYLGYQAADEGRLLVPPSQFLGRKVLDVLPGPIGEACVRALERAFATSEVQTYEYDSTRNGRTKHMEGRITLCAADEALVLVRDVSERRQIERELIRTTEDLERAQAISQTGSWVAEPPVGGVLTWSAQTCRIFAIEPDQFDQRIETFFKHVHPDDLKTVRDAAAATIDHDAPYDLVHRIVRADGALRWVHQQATVIRDAQGRPIRMVGAVHDITDQRLAEESLAQSERRYRGLFDLSPQPMWVSDRQTRRFLAVNRAAVVHYGYSEAEFLSMTLADIEAAPSPTREGFPGVARHRRRSGDLIDVQIAATPVEFHGRDAQTVIAVDLTDLRRAEEALRQSEAMHRRIVETADEGICTFDIAGRATFANPAMARLLGLAPEQLVGRSLRDLAAPADREAAASLIEPQRTAATRRRELRFLRQDGSELIASVVATPIIAAGEQAGALAMVTDITERKQAEIGDAVRARTMTLIASGAPLSEILESIVLGVETLDPGSLCSVLLLDPSGTRLSLGAAPNLPETYNASINGLAIGPDRGSCGTAAALGERVITADIHADPRWAPYRALAEAAGLRSCWSEPIRSTRGRTMGTFAIYHRRPHTPSAASISIITSAANLAAIAIERKQSEDALRQSEERYRRLADHGAVGIWEVTPEGATIYANPTMCRFLEVDSVLDLRDRHYRSFFSLDSLRTMDAEHALRIRGQPSSYQVELLGARGTRRTLVVSGAPMLDSTARLTSLVGTFTDITELRATEARLHAAEQRNAALIRQTPLGVIIWDVNKRVLEWNLTAERIFGFSAEQAVGRPYDELIVAPEVRPAIEAVWQRLISSNDGVRSTNHNITASGKRILCDWYNSTLRDDQGRVIGVASLVQDVTEVKRLEDELRQSQKMEAIGRLASGVAHDFSSLLTAISGFTSLARRTLSPNHPAVRSLDRVDDAARQAVGVTKSLLTFSRAGGSAAKGPVDLPAAVEDAVRILRRTLPANIELRTHTSAPNLFINGDTTQIQQVVFNLAINARDAMPRGGRLTISVERRPSPTGEQALLTVTDTGVGMTPEIRSRIFEPFFTTKPAGEGTGLGLAITHAIVADSGGKIEVQSTPNQGSAFIVVLPTCPPPGSAAPAPALSPASVVARGESVVFVCARAFIRELISSGLVAAGFNVIQASDASSLAAALPTAKVVIVDLGNLENADTDVRKTLESSASDRCIIWLTDEANAPTVPTHGRNTIVRKPFQISELAAAALEASR